MNNPAKRFNIWYKTPFLILFVDNNPYAIRTNTIPIQPTISKNILSLPKSK